MTGLMTGVVSVEDGAERAPAERESWEESGGGVGMAVVVVVVRERGYPEGLPLPPRPRA
jgi:hypothetical protein